MQTGHTKTDQKKVQISDESAFWASGIQIPVEFCSPWTWLSKAYLFSSLTIVINSNNLLESLSIKTLKNGGC